MEVEDSCGEEVLSSLCFVFSFKNAATFKAQPSPVGLDANSAGLEASGSM